MSEPAAAESDRTAAPWVVAARCRSALGTAAALFCEAVVGGSRRIFSAFVSLDRDNGTKAPVCAWPVAIGSAGLERVTSPVLTGRDKVVVDEVMQ